MWQLGVFVLAIYLSLLLPAFSAVLLLLNLGAVQSTIAIAALLLTAWASLCPLPWTDKSPLLKKILKSITKTAGEYFSIHVLIEDEKAFSDSSQQYVVGYEPHSALPTGIPAVFSTQSPHLPAFLRGIRFHSLASSICFKIPFVRQLWYGLGLRPADKREIERIMNVGGSILLCPGGVQECIMMQHGKERVYLKRRLGFIRMAIKHGASLVPVFAVGQRDHYSWYRLPLPAFISRKLGAAPIYMWGVIGSPIPHQAPMKIIVGCPIVTKIDGVILKDPSDEQVQDLLEKFIEAIKGIYARHGPADIPLEVL